MRNKFSKQVGLITLAAMAATFAAHTALAALSVQINGVSYGGAYKSAMPTFSASGASVSATLRRDNAIVGSSGTFSSGTLLNRDGFYSLVVTARDSAGNVNFKDVVFTIDTIAPIITLTGVYNGLVSDQNVRPVFQTNEGTISATLKKDNGPAGNFVSGTLLTNTGTYSLVVTARDIAGNVTFKDVVFTIRRGTTPPVEPPVNPPVTPPATPETPGTPATPVPTTGTVKTAKSITSIARAVTVTPAPTETCAVPCPDPMDAILKNVTMTRAESADGLGGNLNSCRNARITGSAQDGLLVILYIKKEGMDVPLIGFVKAGAGDQYRFTTDKPLAEGFYTVFAKLAQEGGKTGPMVEVGHFQVDKCSRWLVWLWIAIALVILILGGLVWWLVSRRRRRMEEEDEGELITEEPLEEAIDNPGEDRL